jgi:uncharacterized protein Yka (UPF0111/DUF47 family)
VVSDWAIVTKPSQHLLGAAGPLAFPRVSMISLQKLFSKDDTFFSLLEASAEAGRTSIQALTRLLSSPDSLTSLDEFSRPKEADKKITDQINEALAQTFATQLEREDIEILSAALYKIPKTVEKFAERWQVSVALVRDTDFSPYTQLLDAATNQVVALVRMLRGLGSAKISQAKQLNGRLQQIEGDADKLILDRLRDLYSGRHEVTRVLVLRDLYELLEKIVDRCRDTGNVVTHIVLKHS